MQSCIRFNIRNTCSTKVTAVIFTVGSLYGAVASLVFDANVVGCYNIDRFDQICVFQIYCHDTWCFVYISVQVFIIVFSFGIVAPLILNIIMFHKAKKLRTTVACGTIANVEIIGPGDNETKEQNIRAMVTSGVRIGGAFGADALPLPAICYYIVV